MGRVGGFVLKWVALACVAAVVGTGLGAFYALEVRDPADGEDVDAARDDGQLLERDATPPTTPVPLAPGDNEVVDTLTPTFEWSEAEDPLPVLYVLQFGPDPTFLSGDVNVRNLYGTSWQTPEELAFSPLVPVYWRVLAVDMWGNQSPWSDVYAFVPVAAPASP